MQIKFPDSQPKWLMHVGSTKCFYFWRPASFARQGSGRRPGRARITYDSAIFCRMFSMSIIVPRPSMYGILHIYMCMYWTAETTRNVGKHMSYMDGLGYSVHLWLWWLSVVCGAFSHESQPIKINHLSEIFFYLQSYSIGQDMCGSLFVNWNDYLGIGERNIRMILFWGMWE